MNHVHGWLALALSGLACGCLDPDGAFDAFGHRKQAMAGASGADEGPDAGAGSCAAPAHLPDPSVLAGKYLFAVSTTIAPAKPFVYVLDVKATKSGDEYTLMLRYQPLSAADRKTPVAGFTPWQTSTVKAGGCFTTPDATYSLPASANPIINANASCELVFSGNVATAKIEHDQVTFFCADVAGRSITPLALSVDGSTFAAVRIPDQDHYPPLLIDCDMTPAGALP
jgi:hypothetical protein